MAIRSRLPEIKPTMLSVTDGATCVGFVLSRGRDGFESFDRNGKTIGKFKTQKEAMRAIPTEAARAAAP
jgi:hypothetical protein